MKDQKINYTLHHIISADGSRIGYRKTGDGPGLIILHGGMMTSKYYEGIARSLAKMFTVYIPDRRGRGMSQTGSAGYGIQKEKEDLQAMMVESGAEMIFGHSAGAVIALEASFILPVKKMALYEPPVLINGKLTVPMDWLDNFSLQREKGQKYGALATFIKGIQMGPLSSRPEWQIRFLLWTALWGQTKRDSFECMGMVEKEFGMATGLDPDITRYSNNKTRTLIIQGSGSPSYFDAPLDMLAAKLPLGSKIQLEGYDHSTPNFGDVTLLNKRLMDFFADE